MHVGFALLTLLPGRVGGSESYVSELLAQFAAGNGPDEVTVLANAQAAAEYRRFEASGVSVRTSAGYRPGSSGFSRALALGRAYAGPRRLAREVPSGVELLHHPLTVPVPRSDLPTVTTLHDLQHLELPRLFSRAERAYRRVTYDSAARSADVVITVSEHARERAAELLGIDPARIVAAPHGIDRDRFDPAPTAADAAVRQRLRLPPRFILYPANLWPHKNHERLVRALAAAADGDLQLLLTGQAYGREPRLRELAARVGVAERVRHLGYVARDDLPPLYRSATAVVFPSLYEGFGAPPLEAMACATPVACSSAGALTETVGEAALRFDAESVEAIATAIDAVVTDEVLAARLRQAGPQRARRFTWEASARRHLDAYAAALARSA